MKKLILVLSLLCCSVASAEQKFVPVWEYKDGMTVSVGSVRDSKIAGNRAIWVRLAHSTLTGTVTQLREFNCKEELFRIIASSARYSSGEIAESGNLEQKIGFGWLQVFPESQEAKVMSLACGAA